MAPYRHLFLAAAILCLPVAASAADVQAGILAWEKGEYGTAVKEWRPLAEKGDPDAQYNLAHAYRVGRGVPADLKIARTWYEKAAAQGHEQAQANLGIILFEAGQRNAALPWIRKAADRGDPRCQYLLGTALFNGDVAGKDWPRAYALMTRAAEQGLPQAKSSLAEMDRYIPLDQRQKGVALARKMETGAAILAAGSDGPVGPRPAKPNPLFAPSKPVVTADAAPVKPAQPKAIPAKPAPPKAASIGGKWRVQLGAFSSDANARKQWEASARKIGALSGLQPIISKAGAVTRLQAGPFASRAAADKACTAAKAAGQGCFVVAP